MKQKILFGLLFLLPLLSMAQEKQTYTRDMLVGKWVIVEIKHNETVENKFDTEKSLIFHSDSRIEMIDNVNNIDEIWKLEGDVIKVIDKETKETVTMKILSLTSEKLIISMKIDENDWDTSTLVKKQ